MSSEKLLKKDWGDQFQTPPYVCDFMTYLVPFDAGTIMEPTPGKGNLLNALYKRNKNYNIYSPEDIDKFNPQDHHFDYTVMNPPFTPMKKGYEILYKAMECSDNIIALMPWLTLINSQKRLDDIMSFGLISAIHLPRSVFKGSRVQTCILNMSSNHKGTTFFKVPPLASSIYR